MSKPAIARTDVENGERAAGLQSKPARHEINFVDRIQEVAAEQVSRLETDRGGAEKPVLAEATEKPQPVVLSRIIRCQQISLGLDPLALPNIIAVAPELL